jgi:hypothetical protein
MSDIVRDAPVEAGAAKDEEIWSKIYGQKSVDVKGDYPNLDDNAMEMQQCRAFSTVLAWREAMWDELQSCVQKRPAEFRRLVRAR